MKKELLRLGTVVAALVVVVFVVFVVNQTIGVVDAAERFEPGAGRWVLYGLLGVYGLLVGVPAGMLLRRPRALVAPTADDPEAVERHLAALRKRLERNPLLDGEARAPIRTRAEVEAALLTLDREAERIIAETAKVVFVSTAVSQFGRLDGLLVLVAQSRMVWRVARVYDQRPGAGEMLRLYGNVAATAFVAMGIEDIDVGEQIEPVLTNVIGSSVAGAIPGFSGVASFVAGALADGTANAFLTLRVGLIAKSYCGAVVAPPRGALRRSATARAAALLGTVVSASARKVTASIYEVARTKVRSGLRFRRPPPPQPEPEPEL